MWLFWIHKCAQGSHGFFWIWALNFSPHAYKERSCIPDYLLLPFSQIFASSRQSEAILCNRIKGKCFGLYFQGKAIFINNKEDSMVARREKNQNPTIFFQIALRKMKQNLKTHPIKKKKKERNAWWSRRSIKLWMKTLLSVTNSVTHRYAFLDISLQQYGLLCQLLFL